MAVWNACYDCCWIVFTEAERSCQGAGEGFVGNAKYCHGLGDGAWTGDTANDPDMPRHCGEGDPTEGRAAGTCRGFHGEPARGCGLVVTRGEPARGRGLVVTRG